MLIGRKLFISTLPPPAFWGPKAQHGSEAIQLLFGKAVVGLVGESGIAHIVDLGVGTQEFRQWEDLRFVEEPGCFKAFIYPASQVMRRTIFSLALLLVIILFW